MFLVQVFSFYIFFKRYTEKILQKNFEFLVTEAVLLNRLFDIQSKNDIPIVEIINDIGKYTKLKISFKKDGEQSKNLSLRRLSSENKLRKLESGLKNSFAEKVFLYEENYNFILQIEKDDGIMEFVAEAKRFRAVRFDLIIFWNFLVFLVLSAIAVIFAKNQTKSINALKNFVNDFSLLEKENNNFKPSGAKEIREIGRAFLNMINKIKYLLNSRTVMLAQISHDLRTPLTRMKLQTEFIEDKTIANFFKKDLEEMNNFINEYILFARGESQKEYTEINIKEFFSDIIGDYRRSGYNNIAISYNLIATTCFVKEISFRRAINNILNNSLKYGRNAILVTIEATKQKLVVSVEDDGNGIPEWYFKKIKKPFYASKDDNNASQHNGLGLSIVQQTIMSHRGNIKFSNSKKLGGLSVIITIPINDRKKKNVETTKK
jgi:two-component system osmolarity sensor histidine kinase EnvZ